MISAFLRSGLCNRLRTLDAAYVLSKRLNLPLKVYWRTDPHLTCLFRELFEPIPHICVKDIRYEKGHIGDKLNRYLYGRKSRVMRFIYKRLHYPFVAKWAYNRGLYGPFYDLWYKDLDFYPPPPKYISRPIFLRYHSLPLKETLRSVSSIYMDSCHRFYQLASPDGSYLVPIAPLRRQIEARTKGFDGHVVGVHIRRRDIHPSHPVSPTSAFARAMRAELKAHPKTRFYLATDEKPLREHFKHLFPDRVITSNGFIDSFSLAGMHEAVVELYTLARTRKIIGSFASSYSYEAAWIGHIPICIAR